MPGKPVLVHEARLTSTYVLPMRDRRLEPRVEQLHDAYHGIVGARIPYLPTSENLHAAQHPDFLAREIFRRFVFLTETIAGLAPTTTVALEVTNRPRRSSRYQRLELLLLAKVAHATRAGAEHEAQALWDVLLHAFPTEFPFNYPLLPLTDKELATRLKRTERVQQVVQFTKFWDAGHMADKNGFPHPYRHTFNWHALAPLLAALAANKDYLTLRVSLRPTCLWGVSEALALLQEFASATDENEGFARRYAAARQEDQRLSEGASLALERVQREEERALVMRKDERMRATLGVQVFDQLLRWRQHLLDERITLTNWGQNLPVSVMQAVRATLGGHLPAGDEEAQVYANPPEMTPLSRADNPAAFQAALNELAWLEPAWPVSDRRQSWRTLVTPEEAAGLFTLPMPPEFGQIPGILAQSQPFSLPIEPDALADKEAEGVVFGPILHRGAPTEHLAQIPIHKLDQHVLIAGRSGSGKTNTCLLLLRELNRLGVSFLVLDPLDKRDYRILFGDSYLSADGPFTPAPKGKSLTETMRVYTLGHPAAPLTFNPFRLPPGISVQKHISQLLRCFLTAFVVSDPIPALYRTALRQVYSDCGWEAEQTTRRAPGERMPTFSQFFCVLEDVVRRRSGDYSAEIRGNIRQMTLLRIGSLLEDNASILNVPADDPRDPLEDIAHHSTVIELGHIGSDEDKALIMAFLLTCLTPHIQNRKPRNLHVTLIEEAHRLMRRGGGGNELRGDATSQTRSDFSNLLAEVRGYNQGIIVADQSPSELVASVFSNTATHIMHQIRDPQSFEMMTSAFVLNPAQTSYARHLEVGHAISETPSGSPIHVNPPNLSDALKDALAKSSVDGEPYFDAGGAARVVSDEITTKIMRTRGATCPEPVLVEDYERVLSQCRPAPLAPPTTADQSTPQEKRTAPGRPATPPGPVAKKSGATPDVRAVLPEAAPFVYCAGCQPLWREGQCLHHDRVIDWRAKNPARNAIEFRLIKTIEQSDNREHWWAAVQQAGAELTNTLGASAEQAADVTYCYLVHLLVLFTQHKDPARQAQAPRYRELVRDFHQRYRPARKE